VRTAQAYSGEKISLNLANADIRDVLKVFGDLTGLEITFAPEVQGSVSVNYSGTPWDQALDEILTENGLTYKLEGNKMYIFKK
jgi:type IV pilus assembly protein PilQ